MGRTVVCPEHHVTTIPTHFITLTHTHTHTHTHPYSYSPAFVNILDGNAADLQAECDDYERRIAEYGGVELFLGGIGPDGHIAFSACGPAGLQGRPVP